DQHTEVHEEVKGIHQLALHRVLVDVSRGCPGLPADLSERLVKLVDDSHVHVLIELDSLLDVLDLGRVSAVRVALQDALEMEHLVELVSYHVITFRWGCTGRWSKLGT